MAEGLKAPTKMLAKAVPNLLIFIITTIKEPKIYRAAIIGTIFSVTDAIRETPPKKMKPAAMATTTPTIILGV